MKRFIAVLAGLLIMPAFAEVVPDWYYDDAIEYVDEAADDYVVEEVAEEAAAPVAANMPTKPAATSPRAATTSARTTASRAIPATGAQTTTTTRGTTGRAISSRTTTNSAAARGTAATTTSRATSAQSNTGNVSTRRAITAGANTARSGIVQTDTVGTPLYNANSTAARVSINNTRTSSAITTRAPTTRAATTSVTATESVSTTSLDELAAMTDYCKAQYTQCMDNFCNVLDDNQGRCSCSKNLTNYSKTEAALKQATEELQDVAQKIQYIGLTKDEVETLFTQTEAEAAMQGRTDNTQLANDLNKIKNLIFDVKGGTASSTDIYSTVDLTSLLSFNFDSTGFDLGSLFGGTSTSTNSISNQRGEQLYKTATARCKASVLNTCSNQGVDTAVITNSYDLEIDKQCIVYERSLTDANSEMTSTVRNAKSVLQKARLVVAQQKNQYDLRGCVNALDSCMQDDFVCGSDYEGCLDPTGKFIVNGEIVVGSAPGVSGGGIEPNSPAVNKGLYSVWDYSGNSAWGTGTLGAYIDAYIGNFSTTNVNTSNMVNYLEQKIGYNDSKDGRNYGMCISVLNKCQDYTYSSGTNSTYNKRNDVVKNYMQRVLVQIKTQQDEVLANYAENCISDVSSCLGTNNFTTSPATAQNACAAVIRTCASVTGSEPADVVSTATTTTTTQFPITYNMNGYTTKWVEGKVIPTYYDSAYVTPLPVKTDITLPTDCTFTGWGVTPTSTTYELNIPVKSTGEKTFYLIATGTCKQ